MHSIIIANRGREKTLRWTVHSIDRGWQPEFGPYEILIVQTGDGPPADYYATPAVRVVPHKQPDAFYNKGRAQNAGIESARGELLSFLDAEMLVGRDWFAETSRRMSLANPLGVPTRLNYRVRYLRLARTTAENTAYVVGLLDGSPDPFGQIDRWFSEYERFSPAYEAYGTPDWGSRPDRNRRPIFGNSQFTIRREALGDLRFNEEINGFGFEDLWMMHALWDRHGDDYQGQIVTGRHQALLHIHHPQHLVAGDSWFSPAANQRNKQIYERDWPRARRVRHHA